MKNIVLLYNIYYKYYKLKQIIHLIIQNQWNIQQFQKQIYIILYLYMVTIWFGVVIDIVCCTCHINK